MLRVGILSLLAVACATAGHEGGDDDVPPGAGDAASADGPQLLPDAPADPDLGRSIQEVQDGTMPEGALVELNRVYVTALRGAPGASVTLYLQEPEGQTAGGHTYPEYAAVAVYYAAAESGSLSMPSVGDCVDVAGTVSEFNELTELTAPTLVPAAGACGEMPAPFAATADFAGLATDGDPATMGDQPGPLTEAFEGVLIELRDVTVVGPTDSFGEFPVAAAADPTGPTIDVDDFLYAAGPAMGTEYGTLRGIYTHFVTYKLQPRNAGDLVP